MRNAAGAAGAPDFPLVLDHTIFFVQYMNGD